MISQAEIDRLRQRIGSGKERCPGGSPPRSAVVHLGDEVPDLSPDICTCGRRHFKDDGKPWNQIVFEITTVPAGVGSAPCP